MYDLGCFLYEKSIHKEEAYKLNEDKWWYFSTVEGREFLKDPIEEKCLVITNFITLHFKMSQLYHLRHLQLQIWSFLVTSYAFKLFS